MTASDEAFCWGSNSNGQLGDGSTTDSSTPVAVSDPGGGPVTWTRLDSGRPHTCAVSDDDTAHCWGEGSWGRLGNATTQDRWVPTRVLQ